METIYHQSRKQFQGTNTSFQECSSAANNNRTKYNS